LLQSNQLTGLANTPIMLLLDILHHLTFFGRP
jgi:hypothetical protein